MVAKQIKTLRSLKTSLRKTLPKKISDVIASYEMFSGKPVPEDSKGFSAHHSACKSAVVHAETLLRLARWTEESTNQEASTATTFSGVSALLEEARKEEYGCDEDKDE